MKTAVAMNPEIKKIGKEIQVERGKRIYMQNCSMCHQLEGQGLPAVFPPLAKADYLMADVDRAIRTVLHGRSGPITVNGQKYDGVMPRKHFFRTIKSRMFSRTFRTLGGTARTPSRSHE